MKLTMVIVALLVSLMAWAEIDASALYKEFESRTRNTPDIFSKKVLKALYNKNVEKFEIQSIRSDKVTGEFTFENLRDETCSGKLTGDVAEFSCASKWTPYQQKVLLKIYDALPKEDIAEIEIYEESGRFVFQTVRREICHGEFIIGMASFYCYSKAGIMTLFAGGDAD